MSHIKVRIRPPRLVHVPYTPHNGTAHHVGSTRAIPQTKNSVNSATTIVNTTSGFHPLHQSDSRSCCRLLLHAQLALLGYRDGYGETVQDTTHTRSPKWLVTLLLLSRTCACERELSSRNMLT